MKVKIYELDIDTMEDIGAFDALHWSKISYNSITDRYNIEIDNLTRLELFPDSLSYVIGTEQFEFEIDSTMYYKMELC